MKICGVIICFLFSLTGCKPNPTGDDIPIQFTVKVDSISHTPFGATGDTITIQFYGVIGYDGCSSFSRIDAIQQPLQLDLTVLGRRDYSSQCAAVMVYLAGKEYKVIVNHQGWYKIQIHQPDGSILKDSLIIK